MAKKEKAPKYIMSDLNTPLLNYQVYVMSRQETVINFLLGFVAGGAVGLIFYGGQFRDADGLATNATYIGNVIIFLVIGLIAAKIFMPMRTAQLQKKRQSELARQFRSLLEALAVSLSSGMNMTDALTSAYNDLKIQYSDDAYIVAEVGEMIDGMQNNVPIERMMRSLGERSQIEDIMNFAMVFEISYRAGGNMKDIVRRTNDIISEKMEISEEIETAISSNKTQFNAMMVMPVVLVLMLRFMSSAFAASFATIPGVIAVTIAIGLFVAAYILGQKIMDVKG